MNFKEYLIINNSHIDADIFQNYQDKKEKLLEDLKKEDRLYLNYKRVLIFTLLLSFLLGFLSAVGVLSYSGTEPVNIAYVLLFSFFIPLIVAFFTTLSLFVKDFSFAPFRLFSALMQRFFQKQYRIKIDKNLEKYLSIKNSLLMQLSFAFGFLLAFIVILFIKDIAFAWSSTIIDKEQFFRLIQTISLPWSFLPWFVPSQELIEASRFFHIERLEPVDATMLASWWRFLLASILVYMILLRLVLLVVVQFFYQKALQKAVASSFAIDEYKNFIQKDTIAIRSSPEDNVVQKSTKKSSLAETKEPWRLIFAWNYTKEELQSLLEELGYHHKEATLVGGIYSFEHDLASIKKAHKEEVLLLIKSWDIPTLDFIDFLEALSKEAKGVVLYFQKLDENSTKDIEIWKEKIESFAFDNIRIYRKGL